MHEISSLWQGVGDSLMVIYINKSFCLEPLTKQIIPLRPALSWNYRFDWVVENWPSLLKNRVLSSQLKSCKIMKIMSIFINKIEYSTRFVYLVLVFGNIPYFYKYLPSSINLFLSSAMFHWYFRYVTTKHRYLNSRVLRL